MLIHLSDHKLRNILFIGIVAFFAILFFIPVHAHASSYRQQVSSYDISVTKTWDDNTKPEAVDVTMSYSISFVLHYSGSDTAEFPDSIKIYYGDDLCGTAVKSGSQSDLSNSSNQQYSVTLGIPFHFSSYVTDDDTGEKSETIQLNLVKFSLAFDDVKLKNEASFYYDSGYSVNFWDFVDLDTMEKSTFSESSESGTQYDFTVNTSRSDDVTELFANGDSAITHTLNFTITNSAKPAGALKLTAQKTLDNKTPDESYTFCLLDEDGNILQTKQNDSNGTIEFDPINYDKNDIGKEYTYQVKELVGSDGGIVYDSTVYTVKVTPFKDPDNASVIIANPMITKDGQEVSEITFNNITKASGTLQLMAKKTVNNGKPDQSYTFYLLDEDGNILQTKQNDSEGTIEFDAIPYDNSDIGREYTYLVKEQVGSDEGTTYDSSVYTVKVTPTRNPDDPSAIIADPIITKDDKEVSTIAFNNTIKKKTNSTTTNKNTNDTTTNKKTNDTTTSKKVNNTTIDKTANNSTTVTKKTGTTTKQTSVKTGDQTESIVWLIVSISAAVVLSIALRKRTHE